MSRSLISLFVLFCSFTSTLVFAGCGDDYCCQCFDVNVGWRRDSLDWKATGLHSKYIPGHAKSHLHFNDIDTYTLKGNGRWAGSEYYIRGSAEYGLSQNGRAHEHFNIDSYYLYHPISVETSDRIKRRSEFYDFNAAVGYPFAFCNCRLSIVPLIGFSWHRQHIRVKKRNISTATLLAPPLRAVVPPSLATTPTLICAPALREAAAVVRTLLTLAATIPHVRSFSITTLLTHFFFPLQILSAVPPLLIPLEVAPHPPPMILPAL